MLGSLVGVLVACGGQSVQHHESADASGAAAGFGGKDGSSAAGNATGGNATTGSGGVRDCISTARWCCDRSVGDFVAALCDPSTGTTHCSEGMVEVPQGGACAPEGYDVKSCDELDKLSCPRVELECHSAARCSTMCSCRVSSPGDEPTWYCNALAC